jgi:hypothetical protein
VADFLSKTPAGQVLRLNHYHEAKLDHRDRWSIRFG